MGQNFPELANFEEISKQTFLIESVCQSKFVCQRILEEGHPVGVDIKGHGLPLDGKVSFVLFATWDKQCYVFDVLTCSNLIQHGRIANVLESPDIVKVMYDCEHFTCTVKTHYQVKCRNIFDIRVAYAVIEADARHARPEDIETIPLSCASILYGRQLQIPNDDHYREFRQHSAKFWECRPLSNLSVELAAREVLCLVPEMYDRMQESIPHHQRDTFKRMMQACAERSDSRPQKRSEQTCTRVPSQLQRFSSEECRCCSSDSKYCTNCSNCRCRKCRNVREPKRPSSRSSSGSPPKPKSISSCPLPLPSYKRGLPNSYRVPTLITMPWGCRTSDPVARAASRSSSRSSVSMSSASNQGHRSESSGRSGIDRKCSAECCMPLDGDKDRCSLVSGRTRPSSGESNDSRSSSHHGAEQGERRHSSSSRPSSGHNSSSSRTKRTACTVL